MKKMEYSLIIFILSLVLAACSTGNAESAMSTEAAGTTQTDLSISQLAAGSLQLINSANSITQDQASELIPLWTIYQEISNSDTTADEEFAALNSQIQATLDSEQLSAIRNMNLSVSDIQELATSQGYISPNGAQSTSSTSAKAASSSNTAMGGAIPAGVGMGGGNDLAQLVSASSGSSSTSTSSNTTSSIPSGQTVTSKTTAKITQAVVNALIEKLQEL